MKLVFAAKTCWKTPAKTARDNEENQGGLCEDTFQN